MTWPSPRVYENSRQAELSVDRQTAIVVRKNLPGVAAGLVERAFAVRTFVERSRKTQKESAMAKKKSKGAFQKVADVVKDAAGDVAGAAATVLEKVGLKSAPPAKPAAKKNAAKKKAAAKPAKKAAKKPAKKAAKKKK
jgi:hypothetical protein